MKGLTCRNRYPTIFVLAGLFCLAVVPYAEARTRYRVAKFVENAGLVMMTVSFPGLVNNKIRRKLKSGFKQTIILRAQVRNAATGQTVARSIWTCTVVYDLWADRYIVTTADAVKRTIFKDKTLDAATRHIASVHRLPLILQSKMQPWHYYYTAVSVQFNPVSAALLRKVRRWLATPRQQADTATSPASFFGSSLRFFVNARVSPAEREIRFRSQNFYRTAPTKGQRP